MTKLNPAQLKLLGDVRAAASSRQSAEARMHQLILRALEQVPAKHVAGAAGVSRATLYRLIEKNNRDAADATPALEEPQ